MSASSHGRKARHVGVLDCGCTVVLSDAQVAWKKNGKRRVTIGCGVHRRESHVVKIRNS